MTSSIDDILGRGSSDTDKATADLDELTAEQKVYSAAITRPRPQMGFYTVSTAGTMHGFMYHSLKVPIFQVKEGGEFLSFTDSGVAVVMQGEGLNLIFFHIMRHTLLALREYDGRMAIEPGSAVVRQLKVVDTSQPQQPAARLVKS